METGPRLKSLIRQTGETGDQTCDPWIKRQVVYHLHHGGPYYNFRLTFLQYKTETFLLFVVVVILRVKIIEQNIA